MPEQANVFGAGVARSDFVNEVAAILYDADLMALRSHGVPHDEYTTEAVTLVRDLHDCDGPETVNAAVKAHFQYWFGDDIAPSEIATYEPVSVRIWHAWQNRDQEESPDAA